MNYGLGDTRYKYTANELDTETGVYICGIRSYDTRKAQWLSLDPLSDEYSAYSGYTYVQDDPINYYDEEGEDLIKVIYKNTSLIVDQQIGIQTFNLLQSMEYFGLKGQVTQSFRSEEKQKQVYDDYINKKSPYPAAQPGKSPHHAGLALDANWKSLSKKQRKMVRAIMKYYKYNWKGIKDPVHYQQDPKKFHYKDITDAIQINLEYYRTHKSNMPTLSYHDNWMWYSFFTEDQEGIVEVGLPYVVEWDPPEGR